MALLRIGAANPQLIQMLVQPTTTTHPGYGFILLFEKTDLRDANSQLLAKGTITVRLRPEAVGAPTLTMLGRLLSPFQGRFDLVVQGSASVGTPATSAEVLGDVVIATNLQPA